MSRQYKLLEIGVLVTSERYIETITLLETSATIYRKEFSSMPSASGSKSGVYITVEVVDIPDEQYNAVRDALNEFCSKIRRVVE